MRKQNSGYITLAAALITAALPFTAFAESASVSQAPANQSIDVQAKYEDSTQRPVVYKVDMEWGVMEFTYHEAGTNTWNPETHQYELNVDGSWSSQGNTVTVKNHSNTAVTAALSFQAADGLDVEGTFDKNTLELASAEGTAADAPPAGTAALTLSGRLDPGAEEMHTVGQITVAVN